ncbi:MAG: hypothetical protein DHS20C16_27510 [Phycisphaerae bacterium]|nr:MAG: hypothetical protein DHS20C16_27510 [Phycisphaerae bacterium]
MGQHGRRRPQGGESLGLPRLILESFKLRFKIVKLFLKAQFGVVKMRRLWRVRGRGCMRLIGALG